MSFAETVVWVTGASGGVGAALAREFADRGATLILSGRKRSALRDVARSCERGERKPAILPLDLEDSGTLAAKAAEAEALFGRIDVLVHAAGVSQRAPAADTDPEVVRRIMAVNFLGPVALTLAVMPGMVRRGRGRFAVVSSLAAYVALPRRTAYAASKHALNGFFNGLRQELEGTGVKVTIACPGYVRTDLAYHALTGDGTPFDQSDPAQEKGMDPKRCAAKIVEAVEYDRREVLIGGKEVWATRLYRLFPAFTDRLIARVRSGR